MTLLTAQEAAQRLLSAGKSQRSIAERTGVSQPTISRILSGELKDPAGSILIKLNEFAEQVAAEATVTQAEFPPQ